MSWQECCCSTLLPVTSSCSASLWDLLRAWGSPKGSLGGRAVPLPIRCEAKSAPGRPFHGTQAASVNTPWLIGCRGCLPSGRPRRAGGWEGLRDAALELQGRQQAICSSSCPCRETARPRVGKAGQRCPGHSCDWSLEPSPQPGCLLRVQAWVAGRPLPADLSGKRYLDGSALVAPFLLCPLSVVRY